MIISSFYERERETLELAKTILVCTDVMVIGDRIPKRQGSVGKTVSMPLDRVVEVERFAESTERPFSQAASYLIKMGLLYVLKVKPESDALLMSSEVKK